jgi:hypothetical protein
MSDEIKINSSSPKQIIGSVTQPISTNVQASHDKVSESVNQNYEYQIPEDIITNPTLEDAISSLMIKKNNRVEADNSDSLIKTKKGNWFSKFSKNINNKDNDKEVSNTVLKKQSIVLIPKNNESNELSLDIKVGKEKVQSKWYSFLKNPIYYVAFAFATISGILFVYTALSEKAAQLGAPNIKYETLIIYIGLILLTLDLFFVFLISKNFNKRIHIFTALITLQISAFLYSLKIYGSELFTVYGITVTTQIVIILLPIIIFLQALDIIQDKNRMWVNIAQVFVILNQLFSTVKLFNENSFGKKQFSSDFFNTLFDFPPFVWVLFATVALGILSTYNLKQGYTRFIFVVGMLFPILNLLLYTRVSTYWYQTIMALIIWDMIYTPMFEAEKEHTDVNVMARLMVSSIYHLALFSFLLIFNTVLNFIIVKP